MRYDKRYNAWEHRFKIKGVAYLIRCTAKSHTVSY